MAKTDIWFPLYIGDYMADTMHLSTLEHGAFFLSLCAYYKNRGPLEDNNEKLSRICRMTLSEWLAIRPTIAPLFEIKDGFWINKRSDLEIKKTISTQASRRKGAAITNAKLHGTDSDTLSERSALRPPTRSEVGISQSQSQPEVQKELTPLPPSNEGGEKPEPVKSKGPLQLRAERLMRRRPETPLTSSESRAFKKNSQAIKSTTEEDWLVLEKFYGAPQEETYSRKDLATLVNNWNGEIDRAKAWDGKRSSSAPGGGEF